MKTLIISIMLASVFTSLSFAEATKREKMLLRFILQDEFAKDLGKLDNRPTLDAILEQHIRSSDTSVRESAVLLLGTTGWGSQLDPKKAIQVLQKAFTAEKDKWVLLEEARVLAWFGDDAGKDVLVSALYDDKYSTSSGVEYRKAIIPLLLLDYDFPKGLPRQHRTWGGLQDYLKDEAKKHEPKQPSEPTSLNTND